MKSETDFADIEDALSEVEHAVTAAAVIAPAARVKKRREIAFIYFSP